MVRQKADIMLIMGNDGGKNIDNTGTYRHTYWYIHCMVWKIQNSIQNLKKVYF